MPVPNGHGRAWETQAEVTHTFGVLARLLRHTKIRRWIPSAFMVEVGLADYEPAAIEVIQSDSGTPAPIAQLVARASYAEQWIRNLSTEKLADSVICVFAPNRVRYPTRCTLEYLGAFEYVVSQGLR